MRCACIQLFLLVLLLCPAYAEAFTVGINDTEENGGESPEVRNMLREAFDRLGMEVEFVSLPLSRSLLDLSQGDVDGVAAHFMAEVEEFDNLVVAPQPMARINYSVFSNAGSGPVHSWDDLQGKTVGIVRGDLPPLVEALKRGIRVYELNNGGTGFRMVQAGRLDAIIYEKQYGTLHIRERCLDDITASSLNLAGYTYFVLSEKHSPLAIPLARAFQAMLRDGSYKRLMGKFKALLPDIVPLPGH